MYLQKHTAQIAASSLVLAAVFVFLGGLRMPVFALDVPSDGPMQFAPAPSPGPTPSPGPGPGGGSLGGGGTTIGGFGGVFGGVVGGSGLLGGGGVGTVSTGGGGGGRLPRPSAPPADKGSCVSDNLSKHACIPLIQPLGSSNTLEVKPGALTFIDYFNEAADLLLTVSVGFAVLWILIGSYMVMMSGSDGGMRGKGKTVITWALIGLIIVNFAGFFLRTMNSIFFT